MLIRRGILILLVCAMPGCDAPTTEANPQIAAAKRLLFFRSTMEELLTKYCDRPSWTYLEKTHRVIFRGYYRKTGQELMIRFRVNPAPANKNNDADDWVVLRELATLGGAKVRNFGAQIFPDEDRLLEGPARPEAGPKTKGKST